jgi:hypothetical protein
MRMLLELCSKNELREISLVIDQCRITSNASQLFPLLACRFHFTDTEKRKEITGDLRTLLNKELHNLYSSPHFIRMNQLRMIG